MYDMHHRQPQTREKLRIGDPMETRNLDYWVTHAHLYEALSHPSGSHLSEVVSRLARPSSTQSVLYSDAIVMDEGQRIAHKICNHALVLHQETNLLYRASTSEYRCFLKLI